MGCSPLNSQRKNQAKPRLSTLKIRTTSITSRRSTVNLIETITKDLQMLSIKCLKLRIFSPNPTFALKRLDMEKTQLKSESLEVIPILDFTKKLYSDYSSAVSGFFNEVHEQCIPNFNIKKGLEILMISLINNTKANIKTIRFGSFIEVDDPLNSKTLKILVAWKQLCKVITHIIGLDKAAIINQINLIKKFSEKVSDYAGFVLKPKKYVKAVKLLNSCVKTFETMSTESLKTMNEVHKFFENIKLKNIEKRIQSSKLASLYSGKKIVHAVYEY